MNMRTAAFAIAVLASASTTTGFAPVAQPTQQQRQVTSLNLLNDPEIRAVVPGVKYNPGGADTEFARRFRHLVGAEVKTVAEAFADFTREFGYTVNPLYKNMVTDMVGTTHLITVNARFQRDPVWCLGILTALDLLLKNYPEAELRERIISSLFKAVEMDVNEVRNEAEVMRQWAQGKTRDEIEAALEGKGDSPLATIANAAKADQYWLYSRYFGIGLVKLMETVGIEMDKDEVYPIMEDWMQNKLGRTHLQACSDSDLFFRVKDKLDMMETMMKEIEIREKKRMAERLEAKAEAALLAAEKEEKYQAEVRKEQEKEKVEA